VTACRTTLAWAQTRYAVPLSLLLPAHVFLMSLPVSEGWLTATFYLQGDQELFPYNAVAHKATGLNQTPGWGTESGDAYGSGTGYDSGVGTNQSSTELDPYSAVGTKATGLNQTQQGSFTTLPPTPPYVPGDSTWNISDQVWLASIAKNPCQNYVRLLNSYACL
jgi:hypothetical protein